MSNPHTIYEILVTIKMQQNRNDYLGGKKNEKSNFLSLLLFKKKTRRWHKMSVHFKINKTFWCGTVNAWLLQAKVYKHWFHSTGFSSFICISVWGPHHYLQFNIGSMFWKYNAAENYVVSRGLSLPQPCRSESLADVGCQWKINFSNLF